MTTRCIAIDWSGAKRGATRKIWLAEVVAGQVLRLESGRDRPAIEHHLIEEARRAPNLIVGLDFAFSFPRWFVSHHGFDSARPLWDSVATNGEAWLRGCLPPFWGRPGRRRPELAEAFRQTERRLGSIAGSSAKSVFQIGGAGAVGTGSVRGMPMLAALGRAGYAIWPIDAPRCPLVVEIYPRSLTGPVNKSNAADRRSYLDRRYPDLPSDVATRGCANEDAFDALVSALVMDEHIAELRDLPHASDPIPIAEGEIWSPGHSSGLPASPPQSAQKVSA